MYIIRVSNVNRALAHGLRWLANFNGQTENSRNGAVRVSKVPVVTIYDDPSNRVLFSPMRNANPFFHLFESLWMLAGRNDLPWLAQFNKQMATYSDDGGKTQPAAYGHRWRNYFGHDQIEAIVAELRSNPGTRRCVLSMWDGGHAANVRDEVYYAGGDLVAAIGGSADVPCNTQCFFRIHDGVLDMMVTCRSNDILWGAYGANAVHFSMLLEYITAKIGFGLKVGKLYQTSWNFHYYESIVGDRDRAMDMADDVERHDFYSDKALRTVPLVHNLDAFDAELNIFVDSLDPAGPQNPCDIMIREPFLAEVALPMWKAWCSHKMKDYDEAEAQARRIKADDWRIACTDWVERRALKHRQGIVTQDQVR